jgi:hypothetical protein
VDGNQPWMFSSPSRVPRAAFEAGVLGVRAHACDRDYEHLDGLVSCNPGSSNALLRNSLGQAQPYAQGSFTQTYRPNKLLNVIKHAWTNVGLGFLGLPKQYGDLGYGTMAAAGSGPLFRPCSNFGLCTTQPSAGYWYVNNQNQQQRFVTVGSGASAAVRPYTIDDTMACGSMGFRDTYGSTAVCRIDPAVVPLFYVNCKSLSGQGVCALYVDGIYPAANTKTALQTMATNLNGLLSSMRQTTIDSWAQYLTAVDKASGYWSDIVGQTWLPNFASARVDQRYNGIAPRGLYYLFSYSAYEVPFAWWWRCSWLSNIAASGTPQQCPAWDGQRWSKSAGGESFEAEATNMKSISFKEWLAQAPGIFGTSYVQSSRNAAHRRLVQLVSSLSVPRVRFACYTEGYYMRNFTDESYSQQVLNTVQSGTPWPATQRFEQCTGAAQCIDHRTMVVDGTKDIVQDVLDALVSTSACTAACQCVTDQIPTKCALAQDAISLPLSSISVPKDQQALPIFRSTFGAGSSFASKYDPLPDGCNVVHCCASNYACPAGPRRVDDAQCQCFKSTPSAFELVSAGLNPTPNATAWLIFSDSSTKPTVSGSGYLATGANYVALDLCQASGKYSRCTFADPNTQDDCSRLPSNVAQSVRDLYCGSGALFGAQDDAASLCAGKIASTQSECLGGSSLASKYIFKPTNIVLDVYSFSVPDVDCWTLSCKPDGAWASFHGTTTYNPTGFTGGYVIDVESTQVQWMSKYGSASISTLGNCRYGGCWKWDAQEGLVSLSSVNTYVSDATKFNIKVLSYNTMFCSPTVDSIKCAYNPGGTRYNATQLNNVGRGIDTNGYTRFDGYTVQDTASFPFLSVDRLKELNSLIISKTETFFSIVRPSTVCQQLVIQDEFITSCANDKFKIKKSAKCSSDELKQAFLAQVPLICATAANTEWFHVNFCYKEYSTVNFCRNMASDNDQGIPARDFCIYVLSNSWVAYSALFSFSCSKTVYSGSFDDSCDRTKKTCPYTEADQTTMVNSGLPKSGFCPTCVPPSACQSTKSTDTYARMKANINIHNIMPTAMTGSLPRMPLTSKYYSLKLNAMNQDVGVPTCSATECGSNSYKVEIYKGMFVCLPCRVVPPKYCSGAHMCRFLAWDWPSAPLRDAYAPVFTDSNNSYAAVLEAVRANVLASLPSTVGSRPVWHDLLEPYGFGNYNPLELKQGYNDNMESLDSYCSSNSKLPVFTNCQNDDPRTAVRNFTRAQYKTQDGSSIPASHTLSWFASKAQLLGTNVAAWHMASRQAFFNQLFDDAICKNGTIGNLNCFQDAATGTTLTVNPVLSGRFEIQEGCDVVEADSTRVIDSVCNAQACPPNPTAGYDIYNTFTGTNYALTSAQMRCKLRNGATAAYLSTPKSSPTNLCSVQPPVPASCTMAQGLLGQPDYDGAQASSVYSRLRWPSNYMRSGLLSGANALLKMQAANASVLSNFTLDPYDIGGHYIRMRLDSYLQIVGLPLRSFAGLADAAALPSVDWVAQWRRLAISEGRALDQLYALRTCSSWDCPLRRRYFWSGQGASFRPQVPNPFRTSALYGTLTHPTTRPAPIPAGVLAPYKTRNGFCACLAGDACLPASGPCSAADTVASLSDFQFRSALALQTECAQQVDWPWTGGTLRDESPIATSASNCGVLGRLPAFLYRYKNSQTILDSDQTTLDEGGDCHMGRPAAYSATVANCTLLEKRDLDMVLSCAGANVTLARPKSASVTFTPRRRCSQCDPLPTFHSPDGTQLPESEVSYGKLWRWAPARKLYQDLRFRLCGNATACPQLANSTLGNFWFELMARGKPSLADQFAQVPVDPDAWSDKPWMLCTTNSNGSQCQGAASKRSWLADRSGTCSQIKTLPNAADAVADLTVCDLDETLDNLCRVVQRARYRLFEANCQLEGSCRTSSFFYQPATYSVTNDQLSRQTVQYFYDYKVSGSCPAMTEELQAILAQNQRTAQDCSAQSLEMFQLAIGAARQVVHLFVKIFYYMTEIWMNIMALIMAADPTPVIQSIMTNFKMLLAEFRQFFVTLGDMFYKMIMETGQLGKFIRDLVMSICRFLRDIIDSLLKPLTCFIKDFVIGIITVIRTVASALTFGQANLSALDDWKSTVSNQFNCDFDNPFKCANIFPENQTGPTRLPLPTRCWVGYKPSVGDQRGLGCSASDTCMDDDGSLVACAACSGGTDLNRYGCDSLTKLCRCHTFPVGQSQCSSHQECYLPDVECGFVDAYLQPSFGNVPCSRCSQKPVCLVSGGKGQCTCMLRATSLQTCSPTYHAQRVSPDTTQLCLVSLGISASSSSSYSANYRDLASTPCANLNGAQTWCLSVWLDQGGDAYMAVGLALLRGRRLLAQADLPSSANWSVAYEPCRSLMEADPASLGILERHAASDCERWRLIGERTILTRNLTDVSAEQFTSFTGLAEATLPLEVYLGLVSYAEWVQPATVVARRFAHVLAPLLNKTAALFQALEAMPSVQEQVASVKELLPWFAAAPAFRNESAGGRRRLLSWKENLEAAKQYSVQIANGNAANLAPDLANEWSSGPFLWPPSYSYTEQQHVCLAAEIGFNMTLKVFDTTIRYYTKAGPQRPSIDRSFAGSLPALAPWKGTQAKNEPWLVGTFKGLAKSLVGFDFSVLKTYLSSPDGGVSPSPFSQDLIGLIRCDFEAVQHCTAHRRSLFWGGVIVTLVFAALSFFFRLLGVPMADPLLLIGYVPAVMYYVFGTSVFCYPMVPTCFAAEWLDLIQTVLPSSFQWPSTLQYYPGCADGAPAPSGMGIAPGTAQCFRDCTEFPFDYQTWEDNVAWMQCELGYCDSGFVDTVYRPWAAVLPVPQPFYDMLQMQRYSAAIRKKRTYLQSDDDRMAQRVCCLFTIFNAVPVALGGVGVAVAALAAAALAVAVAQNLVALGLSLIAFIHSY